MARYGVGVVRLQYDRMQIRALTLGEEYGRHQEPQSSGCGPQLVLPNWCSPTGAPQMVELPAKTYPQATPLPPGLPASHI